LDEDFFAYALIVSGRCSSLNAAAFRRSPEKRMKKKIQKI
jgi:hypothetical protein